MFSLFSTGMERAIVLQDARCVAITSLFMRVHCALSKGKLPTNITGQLPPFVPAAEFLALVRSMLSNDSRERPTAEAILRMPLLSVDRVRDRFPIRDCILTAGQEVDILEQQLAERDRLVADQSSKIAALQKEIDELKQRSTTTPPSAAAMPPALPSLPPLAPDP